MVGSVFTRESSRGSLWIEPKDRTLHIHGLFLFIIGPLLMMNVNNAYQSIGGCG